MASGEATRRTTRRDLLKQYYMEPEAEVVVKRIDPIDIDTPAFHAELSHNMAITGQTLPELLHSQNKLITEIKEFDGNVKTLVYQNYSKFLGATDTITKINQNAVDMDIQVKSLQNKLLKVTRQIDALEKKVQPNLDKMNHLSGIHSLVTKVIDLFGALHINHKC